MTQTSASPTGRCKIDLRTFSLYHESPLYKRVAYLKNEEEGALRIHYHVSYDEKKVTFVRLETKSGKTSE